MQMIKVLIVEDDKFARQGIINTMPWEANHMEVAGEASNGKAALEILKTQEIDLILSDYSMPGMDGIELLKRVKETYPWITFCMITLYESFEIIQKAVRYGAADYVSKLQLEEENFEQVLANLENKVMKERENRQKHIKADVVLTCPEKECFILSCIANQNLELLTEKHYDFFKHNPIEVDNNIYAYYLTEAQAEKENQEGSFFSALRQPWYLIRITGLEDRDQNKFFKMLRRYYRYYLFYYHERECITYRELERRTEEILTVTEEDIVLLENVWLDTKWLYHGTVFEQQLESLKSRRLPFNVLFKLLVRIEDSVLQRYAPVFRNMPVTLPYTFYSWEDVSGWLTALFNGMKEDIKSRHLVPEVMESIMKAVKLIHEEMEGMPSVVEAAERVNMSRSYFSLCFKKVTDMSFNQYVREEKMKAAREYLEKTDLSVMEIAARIGYEDEKYFSKVFAKETGFIPTKYRKEKKEHILTVI